MKQHELEFVLKSFSLNATEVKSCANENCKLYASYACRLKYIAIIPTRVGMDRTP